MLSQQLAIQSGQKCQRTCRLVRPGSTTKLPFLSSGVLWISDKAISAPINTAEFGTRYQIGCDCPILADTAIVILITVNNFIVITLPVIQQALF